MRVKGKFHGQKRRRSILLPITNDEFDCDIDLTRTSEETALKIPSKSSKMIPHSLNDMANSTEVVLIGEFESGLTALSRR